MRYFCLKNRKNYRSLRALPPDPLAFGGCFASRPPLASGGWGVRPQIPATASMTNSWLRDCFELWLFDDLSCSCGLTLSYYLTVQSHRLQFYYFVLCQVSRVAFFHSVSIIQILQS